MLELNKNGDLVKPAYPEAHDPRDRKEVVFMPAAELRAAGLVQGEVGISREQAEDLAQYYRDDATKYAGWGKVAKAEYYKAEADRLRAALKENEQAQEEQG